MNWKPYDMMLLIFMYILGANVVVFIIGFIIGILDSVLFIELYNPKHIIAFEKVIIVLGIVAAHLTIGKITSDIKYE